MADKRSENPLKAAAENADINTGTPTVAVSDESEKTAPAKPVLPHIAQPGRASEPEKNAKPQAARESSVVTTTDPLPGAQAVTLSAQAATKSPPTDSKLLTASERAEVTRQVADGMGAMPLPAKPGATQQMSLLLHPKEWGSLQVSVTVVHSAQEGSAKTVTAHLVAETPQIKAALQSQTGALHQALRASGMHLEQVTISVKPGEPKAAGIKPAAESASAGLSSGQQNTSGQQSSSRQPDISTPRIPQADTSAANTNTSGGQAQAGHSSASFAGSSQHGRQEQPPSGLTAAAEMEPEESGPQNTPRPVWSRIDTRA